jgi:DNA-directed RNA polymerase
MCGKTFHYDFQLDSRGRMYPIVNYFEPSGSDLAKGLLTFKNGVPVSDNVLYNLAVHTANCMGEDKLAMEDRVLFVWVHMDEILEAAEDLANSEWLKMKRSLSFN